MTCILDLNHGSANFWLNGVDMGSAIDGLDTKQRWFPACSLAGGQQIQFNFDAQSTWPTAYRSLKESHADWQDTTPEPTLNRECCLPNAPPLEGFTCVSAGNLEGVVVMYVELELTTLHAGWFGMVYKSDNGDTDSWGIGIKLAENGALSFGGKLVNRTINVTTRAGAGTVVHTLGVGVSSVGNVFWCIDGHIQGKGEGGITSDHIM